MTLIGFTIVSADQHGYGNTFNGRTRDQIAADNYARGREKRRRKFTDDPNHEHDWNEYDLDMGDGTTMRQRQCKQCESLQTYVAARGEWI